MTRAARLIALAACSAVAIRVGRAQTRAASSASLPGHIIARATAGPDSAQAFAVYLPSGYTVRDKWPALMVMDPRGRGMFGLNLFAAAAERHGFVVLSSYNTLSDGAIEPNIGAINAMLAEVQDTLSIDMSRLYLAGFSGTARIGWSFALQAPKNSPAFLQQAPRQYWMSRVRIPCCTDPASLSR